MKKVHLRVRKGSTLCGVEGTKGSCQITSDGDPSAVTCQSCKNLIKSLSFAYAWARHTGRKYGFID